MEPNFSHPKPRPTTPHVYFDISFLAKLKQKIKTTNKLSPYQFKCLFIVRFWHRRHFLCLQLFKTYQKMKVKISEFFFNRPSVAEAVLQTVLSFVNWLNQWVTDPFPPNCWTWLFHTICVVGGGYIIYGSTLSSFTSLSTVFDKSKV